MANLNLCNSLIYQDKYIASIVLAYDPDIVDVDVDDEMQMFCSGSGIDTPTMTVWFQRR